MALDNNMRLDPVVAYVTSFDDWSTRMLAWSIQRARDREQKVLPVMIDSFGGDIYSLMAMIDLLKESSLTIYTIAVGKAMSAGAFLLSIGEKRYCTENCTIMIHAAHGSTSGSTSAIEKKAKEVTSKTKKMFSMLNKNTGNPAGFFENLYKENDNADLYLETTEAKDYGLVTDIGLPMLKDIFADNETTDIEDDENEDEEMNDKKCLKVLMSYVPIPIDPTKNKNNDDQMEEKPMDLLAVLKGLSVEQKKPVEALQAELETTKAEKTKLETDFLTAKQKHEDDMKAFQIKADKDFVSSLIIAKKLPKADEADTLEILADLSDKAKEKYKNKLLAKSSVVESEIPDPDGRERTGDDEKPVDLIKAMREHAEANKLDLAKDYDKIKAAVLAKGGK